MDIIRLSKGAVKKVKNFKKEEFNFDGLQIQICKSREGLTFVFDSTELKTYLHFGEHNIPTAKKEFLQSCKNMNAKARSIKEFVEKVKKASNP